MCNSSRRKCCRIKVKTIELHLFVCGGNVQTQVDLSNVNINSFTEKKFSPRNQKKNSIYKSVFSMLSFP